MIPNDVVKYEFIGKKIEVIDSKNKNLIGVKGKVIDETKNMFVLDSGKRIIKDQCTFDVTISKSKFRINGEVLVGRPEDRLKKNLK